MHQLATSPPSSLTSMSDQDSPSSFSASQTLHGAASLVVLAAIFIPFDVASSTTSATATDSACHQGWNESMSVMILASHSAGPFYYFIVWTTLPWDWGANQVNGSGFMTLTTAIKANLKLPWYILTDHWNYARGERRSDCWGLQVHVYRLSVLNVIGIIVYTSVILWTDHGEGTAYLLPTGLCNEIGAVWHPKIEAEFAIQKKHLLPARNGIRAGLTQYNIDGAQDAPCGAPAGNAEDNCGNQQLLQVVISSAEKQSVYPKGGSLPIHGRGAIRSENGVQKGDKNTRLSVFLLLLCHAEYVLFMSRGDLDEKHVESFLAWRNQDISMADYVKVKRIGTYGYTGLLEAVEAVSKFLPLSTIGTEKLLEAEIPGVALEDYQKRLGILWDSCFEKAESTIVALCSFFLVWELMSEKRTCYNSLSLRAKSTDGTMNESLTLWR
ncbi:hypothetical protein M427DRAFT_40684 [Gonapodya prolifera JEL478]|uniref:Uncharacterized protein n=1 Tax=Gonapodya prolifera (strain JEL478) TaxID=1344416 RepID=A0A139AYW5_GONPJ|nr:hypothetical protein M427DRAFT_40684 [Gonapodya prolifera JEL478]|eukprot:KXS21907.1 hypothetical protein M427DRAFT_40684 [Gonapodya prolifera JEL478]